VVRLGIEEGADLVDRALARSVDEFGKAVADGREVFDGNKTAGRLFKVSP
jgi:hypothetical protein